MPLRSPLCLLCWLSALSLAALVTFAGQARGEEGIAAEKPLSDAIPADLRIERLEAHPAEIELTHALDYRQVLLLGHTADGQTIDLTRELAPTAKPSNVQLTADGLLTPRAAGAEALEFSYQGKKVRLPVRVEGHDRVPTPSFVRDVQPALSKMSCNAGTCHGSAGGKGGFKLSLRGYDPLFDHRALTDDIAARRFNRVAPDQSLMLLKASGSIPHVGGVRTEVDSNYYRLIRAWIAQGVRLDLDAPRVESISVTPSEVMVPRPGMRQQFRVEARYSDGAVRDVTREAFIESGSIELLSADANGLVTTLRRGEAPVLVRYEGRYAATTVVVMGDRSGFEWEQPPTHNYIDELVYQKLQRVKILPSELCTEEEFVRRVHLDLTGLPPTSEQVLAFLEDPRESREKRDALVDQLVGSGEFVEHWTNKWADLLQVNRKFLGERGAVALRNWIKEAVATNKPYDRFARELLTASGSNLDNPPAAYYKTLRDPADAMENTTHLFLAIRFNCNKCHDHPFERWTQDQYYHMAAYFSQVGLKPDPAFKDQKIGGSAVEGAKPLVEIVFDRGSGEVTHERTGQVAPPAFPYDLEGVDPPAGGSRRAQLAAWITSPANPYFARSYVNRLWGYMFGKGIIEPIDDIRAGNPPTNPELLAALERDFLESGFNVQHMFRAICKSRVYQHSFRTNRWNEDDEVNYSRAVPRRLPAEVLYDSIYLAAGASSRLPGVPAGMRAAELPDAGVSLPFLDDLGRPVRESACECERSTGMVLGPILKLVNGPEVAQALADPQNELTRLTATQPDDGLLIDEVFLRFLSRRPTEAERRLGLEALTAPEGEIEQARARLAEHEAGFAERFAAWERAQGSGETVWRVLQPETLASQAGAEFTKLEDGSVRVGGKLDHDQYTFQGVSDVAKITGLRLEALADDSLPAKGPGRAQNGNFVLNELGLSLAPKGKPEEAKPIPLVRASASFSQQSWDVAGAVDGNPGSGWAVSPRFGQNHEAVFETAEPAEHAGGTALTVTFLFRFQDKQHNLGRFRLAVTDSPNPAGKSNLPAPVLAALAVPPAERTDAQRQTLENHFRSLDTQLARLQNELNTLTEQAKNARLIGVQDLAWALINNPAFLFNR